MVRSRLHKYICIKYICIKYVVNSRLYVSKCVYSICVVHVNICVTLHSVYMLCVVYFNLCVAYIIVCFVYSSLHDNICVFSIYVLCSICKYMCIY